eukprot:tig00020697_g13102.t1
MSIPAELAEDFAFVQATWANSGGTQGATPEMEQRADALGATSPKSAFTSKAKKSKSKQPKPEPPVDVPPSPAGSRPPTAGATPSFSPSLLPRRSPGPTPSSLHELPPSVIVVICPSARRRARPEPADDAKSEASDVESDINDFIDFDVPIPYDSESSSDSEGDNENPTRKRRIIKTKSIVKKKFMETTERLTQHVKTIEKRVLCNELRKELERKRRHERLVQYQINKARIAERKQKEAAELKARIEAQQQREAEAAAALAAQRERERQDLGLIELVSDDDDSDFEML